MPLPTGRPQITNETPGPALALLAICSAGASSLVAGSAILYQLCHRNLARGSKLDLEWNIVLTIALALCIAQSAITADQVQYGLGYPIRMLTPQDETHFDQLEYANNLLYIGSLLLLKAVQFLLQISMTFPKPNYWVPALVLLGMLGFLFAAAFECSSPFWRLRDNQCFNQTAFWYAFGAFDIVTDIYSVTTVMYVTAGLNLQSAGRIKLLIILGSKFLYDSPSGAAIEANINRPTACAIARFPFIHSAYTSSNYTIELYKLSMPTQIQLHLSIVALSLGKIFRFLNFLDVGYLSSTIEPTTGKGTVNRTRAGKYGFNSKLSNHSTSGHGRHKSIGDHDSSKNLITANSLTEVGTAVPMQPLGHIRQPNSDGILVTTQYEVRRISAEPRIRDENL